MHACTNVRCTHVRVQPQTSHTTAALTTDMAADLGVQSTAAHGGGGIATEIGLCVCPYAAPGNTNIQSTKSGGEISLLLDWRAGLA